MMAEKERERDLVDAPQIWKATIWKHFGFYSVDGKVDHSRAVCKKCRATIKHVGNTTNFSNHLTRWHPELAATNTPPQQGPQKSRIEQSLLSSLPPNSDRAKKITRSVACFIAKDLRPYSVVENAGVRHMMKSLPNHNHT